MKVSSLTMFKLCTNSPTWLAYALHVAAIVINYLLHINTNRMKATIKKQYDHTDKHCSLDSTLKTTLYKLKTSCVANYLYTFAQCTCMKKF